MEFPGAEDKHGTNVGAEEEERVNLTYDADLTEEIVNARMGGNGNRKLEIDRPYCLLLAAL